ncbi:hypothetical protein D030_1800B, partial [Vibrio parahaemolyticus AQ3810]
AFYMQLDAMIRVNIVTNLITVIARYFRARHRLS